MNVKRDTGRRRPFNTIIYVSYQTFYYYGDESTAFIPTDKVLINSNIPTWNIAHFTYVITKYIISWKLKCLYTKR